MKETERDITNPEYKLKGRIYGSAPVQGEGTINDNPFYFRARHDEWTFAISETSEVDPVDIQLNETGLKYGFFKEEPYGDLGSESASYMDFSVVEKIILECCKEYQKRRNIG